MKSILKNSGYLLVRLVLVGVLSLTTLPLVSITGAEDAVSTIQIILAVLYGFALLYFFGYTLQFEGAKDTNRIRTGQMPEMPYKGFVSAAIVLVPICAAIGVTFLFTGDANFNSAMALIRTILSAGGLHLYFLTIDFSAGAACAAVCGLYALCIICSGVGYIFGYKEIHPIKSIIDTNSK